MNRRISLAAAALVALAAGCTDHPTGLTPDAALLTEIHQAGSGNAWHGYTAPSVEYDAATAPLEICATWADDRLFAREDGRFASTDFFSFDFRWRVEGADEWSEGSARNAEGTQRGCYVLGALPEGRYELQVSAMARHQIREGQRMVTTTHHTVAWSGVVNIGDVDAPTFIVTIDPSSASTIVGGTQAFTATVTDSDGVLVAAPTLVWSSDDPEVATVDPEGVATGLAAGTVKISVSYEGIRADATLTVDPLVVTRIEVTPTSATTDVGATQQFTATVYDQFDQEMEGQSVVWSSLNAAVATVNESGLATGLSAGQAGIRAEIGVVSGGSVLTVQEVVAGPEILAETISAGTGHSCGLDVSGNAYCWGWNDRGQLGNGSRDNSSAPVAVQMPSGVTFVSVSGGGEFTVALDATGRAYAWGANGVGQLGDGSGNDSNIPVAVSMPAGVSFTTISAGSRHALALATTGEAYAWGFNINGGLGDNSTINRDTPVRVHMPSGVQFTGVSAGSDYSMAIASTGRGYGWGHNSFGQLGNGSTARRVTPGPVSMPSGVTFAAISAGSVHTVALANTGDAFAWGNGADGQLGNGASSSNSTPLAVTMPAGVTFTSITAGARYTAAIASSGNAYAWGWNSNGRLGDGSTINRTTPAPVVMPEGVTFISLSAGSHSLALASSGAAYAWGSNGYGQLGDGSTITRLIPVQVTGGITFVQP